MRNRGQFGVWPGCLLSTAMMVTLLVLETRIAHPPIASQITQLGIALATYAFVAKWVQTHPQMFLDEYDLDQLPVEQPPNAGAEAMPSDPTDR